MERLLRSLPPRPQPVAVRYGAAAALVGASFLVLLALHLHVDIYWISVLYPAVMLSAIVFDRGTGVFAAGLSAVLLYVLFTPPDSLLAAPDEIASVGLFLVVAVALAAISEGLRVGWERAAAAERTKDLLLRELGHRIKNNLAMAISVLSLQARSESNPEVRSALEGAALRIQAIADAHDHLERQDSDGRVEMQEYIAKLCQHLREHVGGVRPVAIEVTAEPVALRADQAIAAGLIVNELVTNALKHAFPDGRAGTVRISFTAGPPLSLTVADDGVGCPDSGSGGLGSRLLQLLVRQLAGTLSREDLKPGCRVTVVGGQPEARRVPAAAAAAMGLARKS